MSIYFTIFFSPSSSSTLGRRRILQPCLSFPLVSWIVEITDSILNTEIISHHLSTETILWPSIVVPFLPWKLMDKLLLEVTPTPLLSAGQGPSLTAARLTSCTVLIYQVTQITPI